MAQFDSVIESVRYAPDGKVLLARGYLRRGAAWSDRVLLSRQQLLNMIRAGKQVMTGQRVPYLAGTFDVNSRLQMHGDKGQETLYAATAKDSVDALEGLPLF